jgi:hypothetical protein
VSVQIEFGGKTRTLKYRIPDIQDLETAMDGRELGVIIASLGRLGITTATAALFYGLRHEDSGLNRNLVSRMLGQFLDSGGVYTSLTDALIQALKETGIFGKEDDEGAQGNAPPEQASQ